jgi:hypothetical protein
MLPNQPLKLPAVGFCVAKGCFQMWRGSIARGRSLAAIRWAARRRSHVDAVAKDGAAVRVPPPLPHVAALLAGIGLQEFVWPLPIGLPSGLRVALASVVALLGLALLGGAGTLFRRTGQKPQPWLSLSGSSATPISTTRSRCVAGSSTRQGSSGDEA